MRIGITERGDAGLDLSWATKLPGNFDYSVLITKNITQEFLDETIRLHNQGVPLIVHATCTGLGGTVIEPHVPAPQAQLTALRAQMPLLLLEILTKGTASRRPFLFSAYKYAIAPLPRVLVDS